MPPISNNSNSNTSPSSHKLLLIINFPTLTSLHSKSHLSTVTKAAKLTKSLLIQFKSDFDIVGSTASLNAEGFSSSSSSIAGSSSSKTTTTTINNSNSNLTPTSLWNTLQSLLASTYGAATKVFIEENRPLDNIDIVINKMRLLSICFPSSQGDTITFDVSPEEDQMERIRTVGEGGCKGEVQGEYEVTAMGGTFDHLHAGHKILLTMAAFITSRRLIVGVSDTVLLKTKKYPEYLESLEYRILQVKEFLELIKPLIQHDVVALQDVYGPTAHDPEVTAIVVSDETRSGGEAVNKERAKKSLSILDVFVIPLISDKAEVVEVTNGKDEQGSLKVKVEDKMGSTGIRKWISERNAVRIED